MVEGIAYIGPIMMWWHLNDNGPNFCNNLMLKWGTYYKIEMQINQILTIPILFLLPIIFRSYKGWKMQVLQIFFDPPPRLGQLESSVKYNIRIVNI